MDINTYTMACSDQRERMGVPFILLNLYIVFEYARPSFIAMIRPALILQIIILFYLFANKNVAAKLFNEKYFKMYVSILLFMALHVFIAMNNYWAYIYFQSMLTYFVISVAFCVFLDSFEKLNRFVSFFILVMALCAANRLAGADLVGTAGQMGDENDFALAMNVALPISFFLGREAKGWRKWFFSSASVLFVLGNIVSESRGGFLGMVAVGAVCWVYSRHKLRAILAIVFLATLAWSFAPSEFKQEISGIGVESADEGTGKDRIELWKVAWRAYLDNPILGVGQGNIPLVMEKYQFDAAGESYWKRGLWGRAIHSVYFTLLPELGLVGLILVGLMFKDLVLKYKKTKKMCSQYSNSKQINEIENMNIALMASIFGFMVTGIFLSAFYYPEFWNLAALIVALYLTASRTTVAAQSLSLAGQGEDGDGDGEAVRKRAIR